ncbi:hypothetical protein ACHAWO_013399 [Cyclotella atomus]|uniref:Uncharacterized protein n=1 Tax=Cyclotella atomus TaxID=382360 RepID=A0ABD3QB82_9STRA
MKSLDSQEWRRELEPGVGHGRNEGDLRSRLQQGAGTLQRLSKEFSVTELQIAHVSKLISDDLHQVDCKEKQFNELFRDKIDEYKDAKSKLEALGKSKDIQTKKSKELFKTLGRLNEELDLCKKKIDAKGSSITDTTPLVEIRTALQRLRSENKELDLRIGVLDYELTRAMVKESRSKDKVPIVHSDDDDSFDE